MSQKEAVSAMMDGELEAEEVRFLLKSLNREGLEAWQSYGLVSDALRATDVAVLHKPKLLDIIANTLEQEPTIVSSRLHPRIDWQQLWFGLTSASSKRVAAVVASVAVCATMLQTFVPSSNPEMILAIQTELPTIQMAALDESSLTDWQEYLQAHHQVSPGVGASAVVSMARSELPVYEASVDMLVSRHSESSQFMSDWQWMNLWGGALQAETVSEGVVSHQSLQGKNQSQVKQYSGF